jgi:hypothetical protein
MNFDVVGPFELARHGSKRIITKDSISELAGHLEDHTAGLSEACGCYVFAIRAGKGYTPYYVGQACKTSILKESLNPSNREKYNVVLGETKGTPMLFPIPLLTPKGKFRKKQSVDGGMPFVDFLERWLIAAAIEKNPGLKNNKQTKFLRSMHVVGILNSRKGEATKSSSELVKVLWKLRNDFANSLPVPRTM